MEENKIEKDLTLDTVLRVGTKKTIAGREYTICPVNIEDMAIILNGEISIFDKKDIESGKTPIWAFGMNITDEEKRIKFKYIIKKYVKYLDSPMTWELLVEHNWSFNDIKDFTYAWMQVSE